MLSLTRTVLVGEDDASGLVFFATYFHYMAAGDQELFAALGHPIWGQIAEGSSGPAVNATCDYLAPVRAGDTLDHHIRLLVGARTSVRTDHEWVHRTGSVAARGSITRCWVDLSTMAPMPVPAWVRDRADGRI